MKNSAFEGMVILAILIVVTLVGSRGDGNWGGTIGTSYNTSNNSSSRSVGPELTSTYSNSVSISPGNASYAIQPHEEYITINNRGRNPVDITGWYLKNGKGSRAYYLSGSTQNFPSDIAFIPQGSPFVSPTGQNRMQNVVLQGGESAIITTGQMGSQLPYKIVSFKENSCSGYLGSMPEYSFQPSLTRSCPRPADMPGVSNLEPSCRRVVERLPSCQTPVFDNRDREGNPCTTCLNGERLSNQCAAFIKERINYGSCIASHSSDSDFSLRTWRVFLGRGWEMWAKEYETIELYDQHGRLVNYYSY